MVVGVGASAGGLQAFEAFLSGIPDPTPFAYVLIQHLNPDHESELTNLIAPYTDASIEQARDGELLRAGVVYVSPPAHILEVQDGAFVLREVEDRSDAVTTIDAFLRSLARDYGAQSGCVILSGTGSDGTLGLKAIKEAGGVCLVQDPTDAEHTGMPAAALRTGLVDLVAPAAELGQRLSAFVTQEGAGAWRDDDPVDDDLEATHLAEIFSTLEQRGHPDFSPYRLGTIMRRLHHRMRLREVTGIDAYAALLEKEWDECRLLARDFLISVTSFFRNPESFEKLAHTIIPRLFDGKTGADTVRVWVPGCATGEEVYSLFILLDEHRTTLPDGPAIQIFASDVDERALTQARRGAYPTSIRADVSQDRLDRYFTVEADGYRIRPSVREQIIFAHHNLLHDPPFVNLDLISCRNLLIYLKRAVQENVLRVFHYALNEHRYLFLGRSETPQAVRDLFDEVGGTDHAYRAQVRDPIFAYPVLPIRSSEAKPLPEARGTVPSLQIIHRNEVARRHMPPSVLVGRNFEPCHLLGDVSTYLSIEAGPPPTSILQMVPVKLRGELRGALTAVFQDDETRTLRFVRMARGDRKHVANVVVEPVHLRESSEMFALITFHAQSLPSTTSEEKDRASETAIAAEEERADTFATELDSVRHRLQTVTEEYETSTEELLASNEELEAANEELRATGEELEVSREEVESANEELMTLNQELEAKIERLNRVNADLHNLMEATDIATLFLDDQLHLRQYTERATELFSFIPSDVGRPFADVSHSLDVDDLYSEAQRVLKHLSPVLRDVKTVDGAWFKMRIRPYRTPDNRIDGVLMTFVDVTDLKEAEQRAERATEDLERRVRQRTEELGRANAALQKESAEREKARDHFRKLFRLGPVAGIITTLSRGRIVDVNQRYLELTGYDREDLLGRTTVEVGLVSNANRASGQAVLREERRMRNREVVLTRHDGNTIDMMMSSEVIERDGTPMVLSLGVDITARKEAETLLRKARDDAEAMSQLKTSFIANMSHEIRTPLTGIIGFSDVLSEIVSDEEALQYVQYVHANGKRLLETLDSVLDLARLDANEIRLHPAPVDLATFVDETAALFDLRVKDKGLELRVDVPDSALRVQIDTGLLQRVLNNLIDNAIKFTDAGTVTVGVRRLSADDVKARRASQERVHTPDARAFDTPDGDAEGWMQLSVADTGVGMSEAFQQRLYEEFSQERSGTDRPQEGAGLGLAITHRLVGLMGGTIVIDSTEGSGTTATVMLPHVPAPTNEAANVFDDPDCEIGLPDGRTVRVLLVDDRPEVGLIVRKFLPDCEVVCAESALEGISAVQESAFDAALVDIQIGAEGTGLDVLQAIRSLPPENGSRAQPTSKNGTAAASARGGAAVVQRGATSPDVAVLALTAHSLPGDRKRFLDEGFDGYVGKPFSRSALRSAIASVLG